MPFKVVKAGSMVVSAQMVSTLLENAVLIVAMAPSMLAAERPICAASCPEVKVIWLAPEGED